MLAACAVALVLLMDASGSIRNHQYDLQRNATAAAITSPDVLHAITRAEGGIAVRVVEFSSTTRPLIEWRMLSTEADATAFANELRTIGRYLRGTTATGRAITEALGSFERVPCEADHRMIDISTDGESNDGPDPQLARDAAIQAGVRINAIGIAVDDREVGSVEWLTENVVTPDGFAIAATWEDYALMIRRKIVIELAAR